jgi:thiol-disulfide isomerase/thioredoxin
MSDKPAGNKFLTKANLINGVIIVALAVLVFVPSAKALLMRSLMGVGLFRVDVSAAAPAPVKSTIDIAFRDASGKDISLKQLKGKVVLLNFWATWCPPCRAEMPSLNSLHQKLKTDTNIVFIAVDADSKLKESAQFMAKYDYHLPLYEVMSDVPESVYGGNLPTTVIFDKEGTMVFRHEGMANYDTERVKGFLQKLALAK